MEHDKRSDELERQADDLESRTEDLDSRLDATRRDYEAKKSRGVLPATEEPEGDEGDGPKPTVEGARDDRGQSPAVAEGTAADQT